VLKEYKGHKFYSSSLLLVWGAEEADALEKGKGGEEKLMLKLIDFTNLQRDEKVEEPDEDLIAGVENIAQHLKNILEHPPDISSDI